MQRVLVAALMASALAVSAHAEPSSLKPTVSDYASAVPPGAQILGDEQGLAFSQQPVAPDVSAAPVRYASVDAPQMGGGFIEFLFGGAGGGGGQRMQAPAYQGAPVQAPIYQTDPAADAADPARTAMDPKYLKQAVSYDGSEPAGTIIINTRERFLYLVEGHGQALRYGIGVGRPGFSWAGVHHITNKREWPDWRPPDDMLRRRPDLPHFMAGGPSNPLGARAMYLGSTLYRIHGSNEPWTIGQAVSSGCIRMRNEDVIDLYGRVNVGTKVVVI
jgi:lipoprotein-anchoring transpeptidase ErfK/SrfK